jgi:hypothetical protein
VRVVDLTQPLSEHTPVIKLPEPFANTPGLTRRELSRYDESGPAWAWYTLELGEHMGTHFDAPIHWITGRDGEDVASVPPARLAGPAVVIDMSAEATADPDYLVTLELRSSVMPLGWPPRVGAISGSAQSRGDEAVALRLTAPGVRLRCRSGRARFLARVGAAPGAFWRRAGVRLGSPQREAQAGTGGSGEAAGHSASAHAVLIVRRAGRGRG